MYVYIYIYIYIYKSSTLSVYMHTHICTYICMCACILACMNKCNAGMNKCMYVRVERLEYTEIGLFSYCGLPDLYKFAYTYIYMYTYAHIGIHSSLGFLDSSFVNHISCIHTYIHMYTHTRLHPHPHICVCIYIYIINRLNTLLKLNANPWQSLRLIIMFQNNTSILNRLLFLHIRDLST